MDFWRAAKRRAQCQRFAKLRDEEYRAAFGAERRGNLGRAQPVAVGLDDGCRSRAAKLAGEDPVVLADRPEIDRQNCAGQSR